MFDSMVLCIIVEKGVKGMWLVLFIFGLICCLYCLAIGIFVGHGTNFYLIWGVGGLILLALGIMWKKGIIISIPTWLKVTFSILASVGLVIFIIVEGLIFSGFKNKQETELDYLIVLGAQLKPSGPSRVLQMRLDKAYDYLIEHEDTLVIVSGGKGHDEPDTEAEGMYQYLIKRGIDPGRIIKEDKSKDTSENIAFSSVFIDKEKDKVGIVSNNFHIFRAVNLAKHAGYKNVVGMPAPSELALLPNNMFREFFGVLKDFVMGNLV